MGIIESAALGGLLATLGSCTTLAAVPGTVPGGVPAPVVSAEPSGAAGTLASPARPAAVQPGAAQAPRPLPVQAETVPAGSASPPDRSGSEPNPEIWKNPEFQKAFLGSYGVLADREPKLTPDERTALEKIVPLMGSDPAAAAAAISALIKPGSSALFDFTLGNLQLQQDRLDEAARSYAAAVQKFPTYLRAWKNLGLLAMRSGDMTAAIRSFTEAIQLGGGDSFMFGCLGQAYSTTGNFLSAESAYRQALLLQPDSLDWKLGLARSLYKQERFSEVAALCDSMIAAHSDRPDLIALQASAYIGMKEPIRAAQNYEVLVRGGNGTPEILMALGDIYVNESLMEMAAGAYVRALDLDAVKSRQRSFRAAEALAARGALEPAKTVVDRLRKAAGSGADDAENRRLLMLQARLDVASGSGESAAKALEEIVALDPLDGEALMLLGHYYVSASQPEKASFYYERAASIETTEADAKVRLAQILVSQSRYSEAVPYLKRAQELKPREDIARYLEQVERVARARQ